MLNTLFVKGNHAFDCLTALVKFIFHDFRNSVVVNGIGNDLSRLRSKANLIVVDIVNGANLFSNRISNLIDAFVVKDNVSRDTLRRELFNNNVSKLIVIDNNFFRLNFHCRKNDLFSNCICKSVDVKGFRCGNNNLFSNCVRNSVNVNRFGLGDSNLCRNCVRNCIYVNRRSNRRKNHIVNAVIVNRFRNGRQRFHNLRRRIACNLFIVDDRRLRFVCFHNRKDFFSNRVGNTLVINNIRSRIRCESVENFAAMYGNDVFNESFHFAFRKTCVRRKLFANFIKNSLYLFQGLNFIVHGTKLIRNFRLNKLCDSFINILVLLVSITNLLCDCTSGASVRGLHPFVHGCDLHSRNFYFRNKLALELLQFKRNHLIHFVFFKVALLHFIRHITPRFFLCLSANIISL